jgi:predicted aspartyl protease
VFWQPNVGKNLIAEIPLERGPAGHLLIRVRIDDQSERLFLIDSGASGTVISATALSAAEYERVRAEAEEVHAAGGSLPEARKLSVDQVTLGPLTTGQLDLTVLDLGHLQGGLGTAIDGILGLDVLALYNVCCLDLLHNRLVLSSASDPGRVCGEYQRSLVSQPFSRSDDGLIIVDVQLNDKSRMSAILDLGAAGSVINGAAAKLLAAPELESSQDDAIGMALGADNRGIPVVARRTLEVRIATELVSISVRVVDLPVFEKLGFKDKPVILLGLDALDGRVICLEPSRGLFWVSSRADVTS